MRLPSLSDLRPYDCVYLSPQGHEAAISCAGRILWERSRGQSVLVVSLFGPMPESRAERSDEVARAMARLGVDHLLAGLPEAPRRSPYYSSFQSVVYGRDGEDEAWVTQVSRLLDEVERRTKAQSVYAPLGVWGHVDHRICHEAALRVFHAGADRNVFLYEERPHALVPGAVRIRLGQLGARLPPAAAEVADGSEGLARFLLGFHTAPHVRHDLTGWRERVRCAGLAARQWREARAWRPQKAFGPRLQPVLHLVDPAVLPAAREVAEAYGSQLQAFGGSAERLMSLASDYSQRLRGKHLARWRTLFGRGKRLGEFVERYWLLLPHRDEGGTTVFPAAPEHGSLAS